MVSHGAHGHANEVALAHLLARVGNGTLLTIGFGGRIFTALYVPEGNAIEVVSDCQASVASHAQVLMYPAGQLPLRLRRFLGQCGPSHHQGA
jgi:hypothetical protein